MLLWISSTKRSIHQTWDKQSILHRVGSCIEGTRRWPDIDSNWTTQYTLFVRCSRKARVTLETVIVWRFTETTWFRCNVITYFYIDRQRIVQKAYIHTFQDYLRLRTYHLRTCTSSVSHQRNSMKLVEHWVLLESINYDEAHKISEHNVIISLLNRSDLKVY